MDSEWFSIDLEVYHSSYLLMIFNVEEEYEI